jgi:hypothetical protein
MWTGGSDKVIETRSLLFVLPLKDTMLARIAQMATMTSSTYNGITWESAITSNAIIHDLSNVPNP